MRFVCGVRAMCGTSALLLVLLACLKAHTEQIAETESTFAGYANFYQCTQHLAVQECVSGFYEVPDFLIFKGAFVYIFSHNDKLYAYGVKNLDSSPPQKDIYNPNPALRDRLDKGVVFLRDLVIKNRTLYDGLSYNFQNGSTYHTKGQVLGNGDLYVAFSLDRYHILSKGFVWRRLHSAEVLSRNLRTIPQSQALQTLP